MEKLQKRKLYDFNAPNKSTGIVNGQCSGIVNWDDSRFKWAYPLYKNIRKQFWIPEEISLSGDLKQWESGTVTKEEKDAVKKIFGLLTFLDSIQTEYTHEVADYITDAHLAVISDAISFFEGIHNQSYSYILSTLVHEAEQQKVFDYWKHNEILIERNEFIGKVYKEFMEEQNLENFMKSIVYDVVLEGVFFYAMFACIYDLDRRGLLRGVGRIVNYINRDELYHVQFFTKVFKELLSERPELNTPETKQFVADTFKKATELEIKWGKYLIGYKFETIDQDELEEYIKFTVNKRFKEMGYDEKLFTEVEKNPFRSWIRVYEDVDSSKQDFFEGKSIAYNKVDGGIDDL